MTRSQQISAFLTAIITFAVVLILCLCYLRWPGGRIWPPEPEPYIEMAQAEEFIEPVEIPEPTPVPGMEDAPAQTEEDLDNPAQTAPVSGARREARGEKADPAKPVTTQRPSQAQTTPEKPKPVTGANEDNTKKENEATARRTNNTAENAFKASQAKNNANNAEGDEGRAGRRNGRKDSAGPANSRSSSRGNKLGGGFTWPKMNPSIVTDRLGTVTVAFTIKPDGSVSEAHVTKTTNNCNDSKLKLQCVNYVKSLKFHLKGSEKPSEPVGGNVLTITFDN